MSQTTTERFIRQQQKKRRRKKLRKRRICALVILLLLLSAVGIGAYLIYKDYSTRVYRQCVIEAGNVVIEAQDFLRNPNREIEFSPDFNPEEIPTSVPGTYPILLKSGIFRYTSLLTVEDTTPPSGDRTDVVIEFGETCVPEAFVKNIRDVQSVSVAYASIPDFTQSGISDITVTLLDASGNSSEVQSTLTVIPVKKSLTVEAGASLPDIKDFMLEGVSMNTQNYPIELVTDLSGISTSVCGTYTISFQQKSSSDLITTYESKLEVVDTTPPVLTLVPYEGYTLVDIPAEKLVLEINDVTNVTLKYESMPDFSMEGTQDVAVIATDEGKNETIAHTTITLIHDTEPPVISGARDITIYQNASISYRNGIIVKDNCDEEVIFQINADAVNTKAIGSYPVIYTATDRAGNTAEARITVYVIEESYSEEQIYGLATQVLSQIITPEMSDYEKLSAIYTWVRKSISYTEMDVKDDWLKGAYYGFTMHKGDCYIYCMTSKALLDMAGIQNMVIDTLPIKVVHYWNLVDIGEGWRHFDTTPRIGGGVFLYLDDASMMAYSATHNNSHIYDKERFPNIP